MYIPLIKKSRTREELIMINDIYRKYVYSFNINKKESYKRGTKARLDLNLTDYSRAEDLLCEPTSTRPRAKC